MEAEAAARAALLDEVGARAPRVVARIHHSHGLKVYVGLARLMERFPTFDAALWRAALLRARWDDELVSDARPLDEAFRYPTSRDVESNARRMIARAVLPIAYHALDDWQRESGVDVVIRYYAEQAARDPQYLGHRLTVLLAFREAWPRYASAEARLRLVERLAEFLIACRFHADSAGPGALEQPPDERSLLSAVLESPGYYGHHLLTYVWARRHADWLGAPAVAAAYAAVLGDCERVYEDPEDDHKVGTALVEAQPVQPDEDTLERALRGFLLGARPNVHLLTLADGVVWLWDRCTTVQRRALLALMASFVDGQPSTVSDG